MGQQVQHGIAQSSQAISQLGASAESSIQRVGQQALAAQQQGSLGITHSIAQLQNLSTTVNQNFSAIGQQASNAQANVNTAAANLAATQRIALDTINEA